MKLIEKVGFVHLKPFPVYVHVITTNKLEKTCRQAFRQLGGKKAISNFTGSTGAMTISKHDSGNIYVVLPFDCDIDWIAHEVYHVARHAAIFTGVDDGEFMAYYIGFLTRKLARWNYKATQSVDKKFWK